MGSYSSLRWTPQAIEYLFLGRRGKRAFARGLRKMGFDVVPVEDHWKFTYIKAVKSRRLPEHGIELRFATASAQAPARPAF